MPSTHKLTSNNIQRKVESSTGAYVLYNSRNGPPRYVGKSEDLPDRLRDWVGKYKYFRVVPTSSITAAYKKEANLYHRHGGKDDLNNEKHPPRPHKQVKCPVCSMHD